MVNKRYIKEWENGDTFAWKIESTEYPEYNGRYFILTYLDIDYFRIKNILVFRLKITDNEYIPKNQKEIDLLEDIKVYSEIYEFAKEDYPDYTKGIEPDKYGYVYQYIIENYDNRKTKPSKLIFIGNYSSILIKNEFYPFEGCKRSSAFSWKYIDDKILSLYILYNRKEFIGYTASGNKEYYERAKDYRIFCKQIIEWSKQLDGPNGKKILKSMGIDVDKENQVDSLTYVGPQEDDFEEK